MRKKKLVSFLCLVAALVGVALVIAVPHNGAVAAPICVEPRPTLNVGLEGYTSFALEALGPVDDKTQKTALKSLLGVKSIYGCTIKEVKQDVATKVLVIRVTEAVWPETRAALQTRFAKDFGAKAYFW